MYIWVNIYLCVCICVCRVRKNFLSVKPPCYIQYKSQINAQRYPNIIFIKFYKNTELERYNLTSY